MSEQMKLGDGSGTVPNNSEPKDGKPDSMWRKGRKGIVWRGRVIVPKRHPVGAKAL